jgi:hypothetical protein
VRWRVPGMHSTEIRRSAIRLANPGLALDLLCGPFVGGFLFESMRQKKGFRLAAAIVLTTALVILMRVSAPTRCHPSLPNEKKVSLADGRSLLANHDALAVAPLDSVITEPRGGSIASVN